MVPHLGSFRVIAQDLPGHGRSPVARMTVRDSVADAAAVLERLGLDDPILVGHSMGGWAALHFAVTMPCRGLVCLDGPTTLDFAAMGLDDAQHAYLPDPPDVRAALASVRCPTMIVLCRGASPNEAASMVPFRTPLSEHVATRHLRRLGEDEHVAGRLPRDSHRPSLTDEDDRQRNLGGATDLVHLVPV